MKNHLFFIVALLLCFSDFQPLAAQESQYEKDQRMEWWREATFGMFIHWGLYALPAGEWNNQTVKKGNVLETARIAGIMGAKRTWELIPMCHPLNITHVQIDFFPDKAENAIVIEASVRIVGQTGVEMEALTAVSVAALTIYDMCKSSDRAMTISDIMLVEKSGGKSGKFRRNDESEK